MLTSCHSPATRTTTACAGLFGYDFASGTTFNWKSVVASAIAAPIASSISNGVIGELPNDTSPLIKDFVSGATRSIVSQGINSAAMGGRIRIEQVTTDAFNNAFAQPMAERSVRGASQQEQTMGATFAEDMGARRGMNPLLNAGASNAPADGFDFRTASVLANNAAAMSVDTAFNGDNRALLNGIEQGINPAYYTSRQGYAYTVQSGDTLSDILNGDRAHIGLVSADNNLNGSAIRAGQNLFIANKDQYDAQSLRNFEGYGQAIYGQDNARLAEMQRRAALFAADDGSGSDYRLMQNRAGGTGAPINPVDGMRAGPTISRLQMQQDQEQAYQQRARAQGLEAPMFAPDDLIGLPIKGAILGVKGAVLGGMAAFGAMKSVGPTAIGDLVKIGAKEVGEAYNVANATKLADQLTLQSAKSPFTAAGTLTQDAINNADVIRGLGAGKLINPAIPEGFGKYTTGTFRSPAGAFQMHFYKNPTTGEVFYGQDYKAIFNNMSGVPKKP